MHTLTLSTLKLPDSGKMETANTKRKICQIPYQVQIEFSIKLRHPILSDQRLTTGLCDEVRQEVLVAVLLAHDRGPDHGRGLFDVVEVFS